MKIPYESLLYFYYAVKAAYGEENSLDELEEAVGAALSSMAESIPKQPCGHAVTAISQNSSGAFFCILCAAGVQP